MNSLRSTYKKILLDYPNGRPTFIKCLVARYLNPSYSVLYSYRVGYYLIHSKSRFFRLLASRNRMKMVFKKNCDISFLSSIGSKLRLAHPIGVVIGANVTVGNNVTIFQNVTLGSTGKVGEEKSYPIIEDNVVIYADSIVIGNVSIGENSTIGAKTFVNIDVPPNSLAVGNPCKIINKKK